MTRQKLAYWFFWAIFLASIPLAVSQSLFWWRWGTTWWAVISPFLLPLGLFKLIAMIKHYRLHEQAWPPSSAPGTTPPSVVS